MIFETTALISISNWLGNKILDKGFDSIYSKVTSKKFNNKFYEKVTQANKRLQEIHPEAYGGNIEFIFKREEVFNELVKLLFLNSRINLEIIQEKFDIETLPNDFILQFIEILREELYSDNYFTDILANKEIYLTTIGIQENVTEVLKITTLSLIEINEIKSFLETKFKSNFSQKQFIEKYKERLIHNLSQVNFIGLGVDLSIKKGKRKNLEDLFVKPIFSTTKDNIESLKASTKTQIQKEQLKFEEIFNYTKNLIILGNPGSGKSMITKFITVKLCKGGESLFDKNLVINRIPFRVELSKYFAFKKSENEGIVKFLRHQMEVEYGFSNILTEELIEIIEKHNPLIIFDGLDEIFDLSDRLSVKSDIENFSKEFSNVRTITTSRIIGYEESALNEDNTLRLIINSFNNSQIEQYVRNWYQVEEPDQVVRLREINDLLSKKTLIATELIANPLLLSLIVILYRNNLKVPESKLEIYESCTKTLVDKWDNIKNIEINLPDEIYKRKDTIFADLAYWQYGVLSSKEGKVTYPRAKNTIANCLTAKLKLTDEFTADLTAEKFLEYAQKRSLYFDNNFTHKTFLEYYTAYWIFTNVEKKHKKEERDALIGKYIENPFWHIVLELLINLIDKDQADNEILDELIHLQLSNNPTSYRFFLQIIETIKNLSLDIFKEIVYHAIKDISAYNNSENDSIHIENRRKIGLTSGDFSPFNLLSNLLKNNMYFQTICDCFSTIYNEVITTEVNKTSDNDTKKIRFICFYLELINESQLVNEDSDGSKFIFIKEAESLKLKNDFLFVSSTLTYSYTEFSMNPVLYAEKYLQIFGTNSFMSSLEAKLTNFVYYPFNRIVLRNILLSSNKELFKKYLQLLKLYKIDIARVLSNLFNDYMFLSSQADIEKCLSKANMKISRANLNIFVAIVYSIKASLTYKHNNNLNLITAINVIEDMKFRAQLLNICNIESHEMLKAYIEKEFKIDKYILNDL